MSAMSSAPPSAKMNVQAIGRNIFPSMPSRARTGKKTTMMMAMPKTMGRATLLAEEVTTSSRSSGVRVRPRERLRCARLRMFASVITTEPSTMMPKSMAPRLSRLAAIANWYMPSSAKSIASGMASATRSPARMFPSNTKSTRMTSAAPASRLCSTVPMTWVVSSVRS